jgi:CHASE3 domain sensor protein
MNHDVTTESESLEAPRPIARALIVAFVAILLLVIVTQGLATWNAGALSRSVATYVSEETAIRDLTLALMEIENANAQLRNWLLEPTAGELDPTVFSLHLANADDLLRRNEAIPERHRATRDAIAAALEDLKSRHILARQAEARDHAKTVAEIAKDRRAIAEAFRRLGNGLREQRAEIESLRTIVARQAKALDISLASITAAMVVAGMLLAFLWKRLIHLH